MIGTEYENMTVVDTILASAGNPVDVLKFNYGSLALNNSFFLDTLVRVLPSHLTRFLLNLDNRNLQGRPRRVTRRTTTRAK